MNRHRPIIPIHKPADYEGMRKAGQLAAAALDMLVEEAKPGVTTAHLDKLAFEFAMDNNALPATLHYRGYKYSICTSINHVVCHGMPNNKPLKKGSILNIDVTLILDGWHGDTSRTIPIGDIPTKAARLMDITYNALFKGIEVVRPGATTGDIGHAIQAYGESERCSIVTDFCGHGLGRQFHTPPNILHYGKPGEGVTLEEGMFFTIEPMLNLGRPNVKVLADGWTAVTKDKSLSAQFEHSIAVTKDGYEIFTLSPGGWQHQFRDRT